MHPIRSASSGTPPAQGHRRVPAAPEVPKATRNASRRLRGCRRASKSLHVASDALMGTPEGAGPPSPGLATGAAGLVCRVPGKGHFCHLSLRSQGLAEVCLRRGGWQRRAPTLQHRQRLRRQRREKLPSAFITQFTLVWTSRCVTRTLASSCLCCPIHAAFIL